MLEKGAVSWKIKKVVSKGDYLYAVVDDHPRRTKNNYVLLHRVIIENHLGRILNHDEIVHHKNHDRKDNRIENLEVMTNKEHSKHHAATKGRKYAELKCPNCDNIFHRELRQTFVQKGGSYTCCSKRCRGQFSRKIQLNRETANVEKAISGNLVSVYRKYTHDNPEQTV